MQTHCVFRTSVWAEARLEYIRPLTDNLATAPSEPATILINSRCHYTKSNPIDDHSNISSKKLQKQNFKPLGHYTCMQCGTSHLQKVQENILSRINLATYRKFTVATVRFTQNVTSNIFTHPIYQQVANVTV